MSKSIMQCRDGTCFLCRVLHDNDTVYPYVEEHHVIFGRGRRRISEHYGLKVYLCPEHHRLGRESPHRNEEIRDMLSEAAQITFEKRYSRRLWMKEFGENYIGRCEK